MKFFLLSLFAIAPGVLGQECDPQATAQALVEHEAKFVQMGDEQGFRAASLHFLAEDAILFQPGPVNAKKAWGARAEDGRALKWQPVFAAVARSCDLGFTTGPSEWRKSKDEEKARGHGQSVSIWKRQKDGTWKIAVDIGVTTPVPQKVENPPELSVPASGAAVTDLPAATKKLREAETWFVNTAKTDSTAALVGSSGENIRVVRDGMLPALGRDAAGLMLSVRRGKMTAERLGGDISQAGDLAYSYGKYSVTRSQDSERGHYLQIWKIDDAGAWKLALDYQSPSPAEQKKPAG